jgi:hypothetical protein
MALFASSCDDLPRDPERTEDLVRESKVIRLGWVEGEPSGSEVSTVLSRIEQATGARAERRPGDSETLLGELEDGKIDLVYGRFADDSPWARKVHFGYPLGYRAQPPKHVEAPRFAMRNGENGWIMRLERAVKQ